MSGQTDTGSANPNRTALAGKRFLVVDDHAYMIDVICEMLKHYGAADCARAEGAEAALIRCAVAVNEPFDCVICDFNMKPLNGLQFLQNLRIGKERGVPRDQRFILITGHGEMDVVRAAKALDVSSYIVKPVAADQFLKSVTRTLATTLPLRSAADYEKVQTRELKRFQ